MLQLFPSHKCFKIVCISWNAQGWLLQANKQLPYRGGFFYLKLFFISLALFTISIKIFANNLKYNDTFIFKLSHQYLVTRFRQAAQGLFRLVLFRKVVFYLTITTKFLSHFAHKAVFLNRYCKPLCKFVLSVSSPITYKTTYVMFVVGTIKALYKRFF